MKVLSTKTIVGPVGKVLLCALIKKPILLATAPMQLAIRTMDSKRMHHCRAMTPGVMSKLLVSIMPIRWREIVIVITKLARSVRDKTVTG